MFASCEERPDWLHKLHIEVIDPAVAPTCNEPGLTEGKHCSVCNEVLVAQIVVDALGHNFVGNTCTACDEKTESSGLSYTLSSDKTCYSVTGIGTCIDRDVIIPDTYKGLLVTTIGDYAFRWCSRLTSVTISDGVTTIGDYAFEDCDNLTSVTIPGSVTTIGDGVFYCCYSLTSVTIPDSVTTIGDCAFYSCDSLTSITVDKNNAYYKDIDGNLYSKDGTVLIQYAIGKSDSSFTIPSGVTTIGDYAFSDCDSLTNVTIPDSVTTIGDWTFYRCFSLTSVTIPDSVTSIGNHAFYGCESLTSVTIPDSVTTIGKDAFTGCYSLTSVTIPDSVTTIGYWAFFLCDSLTSVTIPDSVTTICDGAFSMCYSLTSITFEGTVAQWNNVSLGSSWNYKVPATEVVCSDGTVELE